MVTRVTVGRQRESLSDRGCSHPVLSLSVPACRCNEVTEIASLQISQEKGERECMRFGVLARTVPQRQKSRAHARVHHSKHIDRPCQDSQGGCLHGPLFVTGKCRFGLPASLRWAYFFRRLERQIHHVGGLALVSKNKVTWFPDPTDPHLRPLRSQRRSGRKMCARARSNVDRAESRFLFHVRISSSFILRKVTPCFSPGGASWSSGSITKISKLGATARNSYCESSHVRHGPAWSWKNWRTARSCPPTSG